MCLTDIAADRPMAFVALDVGLPVTAGRDRPRCRLRHSCCLMRSLERISLRSSISTIGIASERM